jgi:hypothetical protein
MGLLEFVWEVIRRTAVLWLPIMAVYYGWDSWVTYVRRRYLQNLKYVLLEIKIPREIHKTPQAMELVLNALYQTGGVGHRYALYWEGKQLAQHSLEIVSIEGNIYFFIRVEGRFKDLIEAQVYGQYPDAEVHEVDDYTKYVPPYDPNNGWEYKGAEYTLKGDDWIPIKTYVDYGLDNKALSLEEEQRIDPLTPMIEMMGSLGKGEQLWLQILIRGGSKRFVNDKGEDQDWQKEGRKAIDKLLEEYSNKEVVTIKDGAEKKKKVGGYGNLPPNLKLQVDAAERNLEKLGFDFGMRVMYVAEPGKAKGMRFPAEFGSVIRQFSSPNLNSLEMKGFTDDFNYPWQDWGGMRKQGNRKKMFKLYTMRAWFTWPAKDKPIKTLTTEELATLFHFPGKVLTTTTFERIESRKAEPPANLPF